MATATLTPAADSAHPSEPDSAPAARLAILVDFDNAFPDDEHLGDSAAPIVNRFLDYAMELRPDARDLLIRLYGGWLDDGLLTKRASALQSAIGAAPTFPLPHPLRSGVLRGQLELVTRLADGPALEWGHTLRLRRGLPRVALTEKPHPAGCQHRSAECPVKQLQKLAGRPGRRCNAEGCEVTNHGAFSVPQQKMVDVLLACDLLSYASAGADVAVISSDLDVLPAVALASSTAKGVITVIRAAADSAGIYDAELQGLGVSVLDWERS